MNDIASLEEFKADIKQAAKLLGELQSRLEHNRDLVFFKHYFPKGLNPEVDQEIRVFSPLSELLDSLLKQDLPREIVSGKVVEITDRIHGYFETLFKPSIQLAQDALGKDSQPHCNKICDTIAYLRVQSRAGRDPKPDDEARIEDLIWNIEVAYGCDCRQVDGNKRVRTTERTCRLLHLSDLHFSGENEQVDRWHEQLAADLREQGCDKLDGIIISGDTVYGSAEASIEDRFLAAARFVKRVMDEFSVPANRIVIVPGNHDLDWGRSREAYKFKYLKDAGELGEGEYLPAGNQGVLVRDDEKYPERFQAFRAFYREICGEDYPRMLDDQRPLIHFQEQGLLFLGLNSAWETDHGFTSRASINDAALSRALTAIRGGHEWTDCLKIAVWHHPVTSGEDDRIRDDAFLQRLAKAGFRLALHGHIHKADNGLYRYDHSPAGRRIEFVGAGTFGAPSREWVPGYPAQYNLLALSGNRLTVHTRRREEENGVWKPDARWERGSGQDPLPRYTVPLA